MVIKLIAIKRQPQSVVEDRQEYILSLDDKEAAREMATRLAERGYTVITEAVSLAVPSGTTTH